MKMFLLRMMATGCFTIANGRSGELITPLHVEGD
jgi:hypothetical protein